MIILCEECNKKFNIDSKLIPFEGRTLQCGSCNHKWFFKKKIKKEKAIILDKTKNNTDINIPNQTEDIINDAEKVVSKNKKINILSYLIVFIITLSALIILADTFKYFINSLIPGFDIILNNLYETLKDVMLFLKDLTK